MKNLFWIFVSSMLVNNFTLILFLGLCAFFGISNKFDTAIRMGAADTFVLVMTSIVVTFLNKFILAKAPYLQLIAFIVTIAALVQMVEMLIKKTSPALFRAMGIYLPLITTNCAVLGVALFQTARDYDFAQSITFALGGGAGFTIALVLLASVRERVALANVPNVLQGTALTLMLAGILSLSFMGFAGLGG